MKTWYIQDQQKIYGPYSKEQMSILIKQQKILPHHTISADQKKWYSLVQFISLHPQMKETVSSATQSKEKTITPIPTPTNKAGKISVKKLVGKYEIIKEIGRGGMGIVYQAKDTHLNRECAVKIAIASANDIHCKRFFSEAKAIALLNHPNIIRIYEIADFASNNNINYYFSMEYIKGISFSDALKNNTYSLEEKIKIFHQVCQGMTYAHQNNIIHRDLKPANILINEKNIPVIIDFGLARQLDVTSAITKTGDMFGTPQYMAPENLMEEKFDDPRSDIYAMGVILYEILTGQRPFSGRNILEMLVQISANVPLLPSSLNKNIRYNSDLEIICMKCLEKKIDKRIQTMNFLCKEIECVIEHKPIRLKQPTFIDLLWQKTKYDKSFRFIVMAFTTLFLFSSVSTILLFKVSQAKQIAEEQKQIAEEQKQIAEEQKQIADFEKFAKDITNIRENISQVAFYKVIENINKETVQNLDTFFGNETKSDFKTIPSQKFAEFSSLLRFSILPNLPKIEKVAELTIENKLYFINSRNLRYIAYFDTILQETVLLETSTQKKMKINFPLKTGSVITPITPVSFSPNEKYLLFSYFSQEVSSARKQQVYSIYNIEEQEVLPYKLDVDYRQTQKSVAFSPDNKYFVYNAPSYFSIVFLEKNSEEKISSFSVKDFNFSKDYLVFFPSHKDTSNNAYHLYDFVTKQTTELIKWSQVTLPSICVNYEKNIFFINQSDTIEKIAVRTEKEKILIRKESIANKSQSFIETSSIMEVDTNDTIVLGMKKEILLLKEIFREKEKYYYHYRNKVPAEIQNLFFLSSRILVSQEKGNSIHLFDTLSRNFLYYQQNIVSFSYTNDNNFVMVLKSNQTATYYRFSWETNLANSYSLSGQSLKDYKLIQKYFQFDESSIKSDEILFSSVDNITTIILPLKRCIVVWQKVGNNTYQNKMYFSSLTEVFDVQLSPDKKMIAMVVNDKKHSPRRQKIILANVKDLMKEDIFTIKPIIEELKIHNGNFIRLANTDDGYKYKKEIHCVSFSSDSQSLYVPYSDEVFLYSIAEEQATPFVGVTFKALIIKENKRYNLIAIAQEDGVLSIVDKESGKKWENNFAVHRFNNQQKGDAHIVAMDWHPIQKVIAFANVAGQLKILYLSEKEKNADEWQNFLSFEEEKILNFAEEIYNLSFSPDGRYLAIFTFDNIYIYDLEYKYYVESYIGYNKGGLSIFSDDWKYCILPTTSSEVLVFDQGYFPNDTVYQDKIKDKGHEVYFKDKLEQDDDAYWPLRLQRKFKEYINK